MKKYVINKNFSKARKLEWISPSKIKLSNNIKNNSLIGTSQSKKKINTSKKKENFNKIENNEVKINKQNEDRNNKINKNIKRNINNKCQNKLAYSFGNNKLEDDNEKQEETNKKINENKEDLIKIDLNNIKEHKDQINNNTSLNSLSNIISRTNSSINTNHSYEDEFCKIQNDLDKKLKDNIKLYNTLFRKTEGTSLNTLYKLRNILLNWFKEGEDLEYKKYITEKKLKFMIKNKEKTEMIIKNNINEIKLLQEKLNEYKTNIGDYYINYDEEGLKEDIQRLESMNTINNGVFSKTLEQLNLMKKILPYLSEYNKIKEIINKKTNEKIELERVIKSSNQTISCLSSYYKNIKKKIFESNE